MNLRRHMRSLMVIQGCLWFLVGLGFSLAIGFPYLEKSGKIESLTALSVIVIASFFAGVLAAVGGIIAIRRDYVNGKIQFTPEEEAELSDLPVPKRPYWLQPLIYSIIQLLVFVAIAAAICLLVFPGGLSKVVFVLVTSLSMCIHGVLVVVKTSGSELLKAVAHKNVEPMPFGRYLWQEHVIGSALINYGINSLVGYVMYSAGPKHPEALTEAGALIVDVIIMCIVVSVLTALNSEMQAAGDVPFKLTVFPSGKSSFHPAVYLRLAAYVGIGLITALIFGAVSLGFGLENFSVFSVMTIKGIFAAVVAAFASAAGAFWSAARAASKEESK